MNYKGCFWGMLITVLVTGCASVLNPYKGEFQCPETVNGKCVSVNTAYDESVNDKGGKGNGGNSEKVKSLQDELKESRARERTASAEGSDYEKALLGRMKGLLSEPVTPMVATPQAYRILFLSYPGDGDELFMPRYVYFLIEKPRWILDNYLNSKAAGEGE